MLCHPGRMDQRELKLRARLHAIELVISEIAAAIYGEGEPTLDDLDRNIKAFFRSSPSLTWSRFIPICDRAARPSSRSKHAV